MSVTLGYEKAMDLSEEPKRPALKSWIDTQCLNSWSLATSSNFSTFTSIFPNSVLWSFVF